MEIGSSCKSMNLRVCSAETLMDLLITVARMFAMNVCATLQSTNKIRRRRALHGDFFLQYGTWNVIIGKNLGGFVLW